MPILVAQAKGDFRWCAHCSKLHPDQNLDRCGGCNQVRSDSGTRREEKRLRDEKRREEKRQEEETGSVRSNIRAVRCSVVCASAVQGKVQCGVC